MRRAASRCLRGLGGQGQKHHECGVSGKKDDALPAGEADRAFEWLDKAVQYHDAGLSLIAVDVQFANIHADPRWLPFLESIGKSPEQLAAIEFNVTLPK